MEAHRGSQRPFGIVATRFRLPASLVAGALIYGTVGFMLIEGFPFLDGLYMAVTTITTVGFGEIHPLGPGGRAFVISLIAFGLVAFFDLIGAFTSLLASGELGESLRRRRLRKMIEDQRGHFIVCAYGRVGRAAIAELLDEGASVVAIDMKPELEPLMREAGITYIVADPTEESVLRQAGVERARGLVCAVDSDAVNVYITLTARSLNPDIFIVARSSSPESVDKLERAGANRIVSPYVLSGTRMAALALRPAVVEFVDMVTVAPDMRLEEIEVWPGSLLAGTTVHDAQAQHEGVVVLAVRRTSGTLLVKPATETTLEVGDLVVALGPTTKLAAMAGPGRLNQLVRGEA